MEIAKMSQMSKVAYNVLNSNFALSKGEQLLVITDTDVPQEISYCLIMMAKVLEAQPVLTVIDPIPNPGAEPPKCVADAMKSTDVLIAPVSVSLYHSFAKEEAQNAGVRGAPNAPDNL